MQILSILEDWTIPQTKTPQVLANCLSIHGLLYERYGSGLIQLVGRGNSGSFLISAMLLVNHMQENKLNLSSAIILKGTQTSSSSRSTIEKAVPLIILDDDIYNGVTIHAIKRHIELTTTDFRHCIKNVEVFVGRCWDPDILENNTGDIFECFPNIKLWIR